ncbi:MAG: hypothetical protein RL172_2538 [Bacteroidota bacterium]
MKVLIIEDEAPAANRLCKLLQTHMDEAEIMQRLDSVEASVKYLQQATTQPDLIFMDIQLADGLSFDIFNQVNVNTPVIFTTAFDQYTLKAFKVNSIDYLLKPIDDTELQKALEKFEKFYAKTPQEISDKIAAVIKEMNFVKYKERLLIKRGQQLSYLKTGNTAFCFADGKLCYAVDFNGVKYLLENNLSQLEEQLKPEVFFRVSRHLLVNIEAVKKVHTWLGGRLKIETSPPPPVDSIVSRERVNSFKDWLGQ